MGKRKRQYDAKEYEVDVSGNSDGFPALKRTLPVPLPEDCAKTPADLNYQGENLEGVIPPEGGICPLTDLNTSNLASEQSETIIEPKPVPQLRTSVRVQNKKREEIKADLVSEENGRKDDENYEGNKKLQTQQEDGKKRAWEVWSMDDKDLFFEAINDCGKDFEGIQAFLLSKWRKKGNSGFATKNKDQIRHFYYRTWHKIFKYVEFTPGVKKATQELYALINYGEFRRKVGGTLNEKKGIKLQELIQKGSASVRVKGKCIRVRTPICRALKKINEFQDEREPPTPRLPTNIDVEITAANIQSWTHVQSLAHNPRVKIICPLDKPVASIIGHLQAKWKSHEVKLCQRLVSSLTLPLEVPSQPDMMVRLRPPDNADIQILEFKHDAQMTSSAVSLIRHEAFLKTQKSSSKTHRSDKKKPKSTVRKTMPVSPEEKDEDECYAGDISQEEGSDCEIEEATPDNLQVKIKQEIQDPVECHSDEQYDSDVVIKEEIEPTDALRQLKALQTVANPSEDDGDIVYIGENTGLLCQTREQQKTTTHDDLSMPFTPDTEEDDVVVEEAAKDPVVPAEEIEATKQRIRDGWTQSSCKNVTVGLLYMMFGSNKKLSLEYVMETEEQAESRLQKTAVEPASLELNGTQTPESAAVNSDITSVQTVDSMSSKTDCSSALQQLLSIVSTINSKNSLTDCKMCGKSNKDSSFRSPVANKSSAYGKSPSHARSPRVSGLALKSPKSNAHISPKPNHESQRKDDKIVKPSSAKRLIPATTSEAVSTVDSAVTPITSTGVQSDRNDIFRVPLAPAPRIAAQNTYNAQINRLLPKYSRQNRRTHREHLFVQRQLPLLPNIPVQRPGDFITLNVLQQPGVDGVQKNALIQVPLNVQGEGVTAMNPQPLNPAAISVNVSGHEFLSVQMPVPPTREPDLTQASSTQSQMSVTSTYDVTNCIASTHTSVTPTYPAEGLLTNLISETMSRLPETAHFGESELSEFKNIQLSPKTPTKNSLTSELFSDNSSSSLLTTPKHVRVTEALPVTSSAKLDLSTYLSTPCFSPCPSPTPSYISIGDCPSIPEMHIPDNMGHLPILDISLGGTVTVLNEHASAVFNLNAEKSPKNPAPTSVATIDNTQIHRTETPFASESKHKILDITLACSNSNSSFTTLLAAVAPPCTDSNDVTLQTPTKKLHTSSPMKLGRAPSFRHTFSHTSPPSSPANLLSQSDAQWLSNELQDFSLSHIIDPLDSSSHQARDNTSLTFNENSVDFRSTFAALKAQIAKDKAMNG